MEILLDPGKGKLMVKEWEYEAVGMLVDGLLSVIFFDGQGEDARQVSLDKALPREVMLHFAEVEAEETGKGMVFDMDVLEAEVGLSFRMKSCRQGGIIGFEGDAGHDTIMLSEQRTPISLRPRSKAAETV